MAVYTIGDTSARLVKLETQYEKNTGWMFTATYEGDQESIEETQASLEASTDYVRSVVSNDGPLYRLIATTPEYEDKGAAADKWEIDLDMVNESIWGQPNVLETIVPDWAADNPMDFVAIVRLQAEEALAEKKSVSTLEAEGASEGCLAIYKYLLMGQDSVEVERPVLRRVKSLPIRQATGIKLQVPGKLYTTEKLIAEEQIPQEIVQQIETVEDDLAPEPEGTMWAWKRRRSTRDIDFGTGLVRETTEWVFACWNFTTYNIFGEDEPTA